MWKKSELRDAPAPLEGPVVGTIVGGTILWFALFIGQVPFYSWYADRDLTWWVWTCLAGGGLGLLGIWYVRKRDAAIKRAAADGPSAEDGSPAAGGPSEGAPGNPA
ncbi:MULTISPECIES: DUF2530 domain-containing protein [unclassified Streptomyces]|uniref:DUF2530 domain-containing protein n=1 Tax=unclassified Streptomyces TaxID=2593676 RepID=UPI0037FE6A95